MPYFPPALVLNGWDTGPIEPTGYLFLAAASRLAVLSESTRETYWWTDKLATLWGTAPGAGRKLLSSYPGVPFVTDDLYCGGDAVLRCRYISASTDPPWITSPTLNFVRGSLTQRTQGSVIAICGLVDTGSVLPAQRIRCWEPGMAVYTDVDTLDTKAVELVATESRVFCARQEAGTVQCLGNGYLGDGLPPHTGIGTLSRKFTKIDASGCGISDGDVYCFGANGTGAIGDGTKSPQPTPTKVPLPGKVRLLSGTTAVLENGAVYVWGRDRANAPPPKVPTPALVPVRLEWD